MLDARCSLGAVDGWSMCVACGGRCLSFEHTHTGTVNCARNLWKPHTQTHTQAHTDSALLYLRIYICLGKCLHTLYNEMWSIDDSGHSVVQGVGKAVDMDS